MSTLRQKSKENYDSSSDATFEAINAGSLQRIADAAELMASNFLALQRSVRFYKSQSERYQERCSKLEKSNAALRGVVTRLKKGNRESEPTASEGEQQP